MLIIYGTRTNQTPMGQLLDQPVCPRCDTQAVHNLTRVRQWVTLFWIPVIPFSTTYYSTCMCCGRQDTVSKARAKENLQAAKTRLQYAQTEPEQIAEAKPSATDETPWEL